MQAAIIRRYGPAPEVLKFEDLPAPEIRSDEVLIRQHASSVNPIDCRMRTGYGRVIYSRMRRYELPLVLGRDVCGQVVKVGAKVKSIAVGDAVYGVSSSRMQGGAYAEFVVSTPIEVVQMPRSLSFTEAAALPYVACTVWAALVTRARG